MSESISGAVDDKAQPKTARSGWSLKRAWPIAVILLLTAGVYFTGVHRYLSLQTLVDSREALRDGVAQHYVAALGLFLLSYAVLVALSIPGVLLLTIMAGFVFGTLIGGLVTVVAATIGATLLFLAARTSFGDGLRGRAGPWIEKFRAGFQEDATSYMLFLRLVPVFPFWLVNLAPALLGIDLTTFVWTTFLGIVPGTFAYAAAGAGLDSVAAAQKAAFDACKAAGQTPCEMHLHPGQLVTRELLFALIALGLVALVPVLIKRWRRRVERA